MGEKFLRTARSRVLFVAGLLVAIVTVLFGSMMITAFTADRWWPQPENGVTAAFVWVTLSQLLTFLVLVLGGIVAFIGGIAYLAEFLFNTRVRRPGSSLEPAPFRTLRDRSRKYDAAIVALRRSMARAARAIRSPFRATRRAVENWIDRGD